MSSSTALIAREAVAWHGPVRRARTLALRQIRRRDRIRARLRSRRLDAALATGAQPESSWLRAVRAAELVTPDAREAIARAWERAAAELPDRGAVDATRDLVVALRAAAPAQARGVAAARILLTDRSGPLQRPQSPEHLAAALRDAIRHLDV